MRTLEELQGWIGRIAQDPYGEPLGTIVDALRDVETGTPDWLAIALAPVTWTTPPAERPVGEELVIADYALEPVAPGTLREGDEIALVPVTGAEPTGRRIRTGPTAPAVRAAPRARFGAPLAMADKRLLAAHYGLRLDPPIVTAPGEPPTPTTQGG